MKDTTRRTFTPEIRIVNATEGLVDYVASDQTLDCYSEIIVASGWRFDLFAKNSPFVDSHDYYCIDRLLGRVISAEVQGAQLVERVKWAVDVPGNELAQVGFQMTAAGYLKAVSVGFFPEQILRRGEDGWAEAVKEHGLDPGEASAAWRIFTQQQQTELSSVILGANPNALLKSYEDGAIAERDLARLGFGGDDSFDFLQKARQAVENPDCSKAFEAMVAVEMSRIYDHRPSQQHKISDGKAPATPGPSSKGGSAEDPTRRKWQEHFLKKLGELTD